MVDFHAFISHGKAIADSKLKTLKNGLKYIEEIERQMDLTELYALGQLYPRKISEKIFYVKECGKPLNEMSQLDIITAYTEMPFTKEDYAKMPGFLHNN